MRTAQPGDRVRVHYVKRAQNGGVASSRGRGPYEMIVGEESRRLPGLSAALVGRSEGERVRIIVPAEQAHGLPKPERVRRLSRSRFPNGYALTVGSWVYVAARGRNLRARIVDVSDTTVVVDVNHPWAGQVVAMDVRIVTISGPAEPADKR